MSDEEPAASAAGSPDELTHTDESGDVQMVDVGEKPDTARRAVAAGTIHLQPSPVDAVRDHVSEVVASVPVPVKVIVEAPLLTDEELHRIGSLVAEADAAFLKTATGFSEGGATVHDVEILSQYRPVKASGGVGSWAEAEAMFEAGADRVGASSGDVIVEEWREQHDGAAPAET